MVSDGAGFGCFFHALSAPDTELLQQLVIDIVDAIFAEIRNQVAIDDADVISKYHLALLAIQLFLHASERVFRHVFEKARDRRCIHLFAHIGFDENVVRFALGQLEFALVRAAALPAAIHAVSALPHCAALTLIEHQLSLDQYVCSRFLCRHPAASKPKQQLTIARKNGQKCVSGV